MTDAPQPPRCRNECRGGPRPCPWAQCRYHMTGEESCALDVADRGDHTCAEIARASGIPLIQVRTIERAALQRLRSAMQQEGE